MYAFREIVCIIKGDRLAPSFNPETMSEYFEELKSGRITKPLPMGAYEYDCCVEYLKKIRNRIFASKDNYSKLVLVFDEYDTCQNVIPPLEDCLEMVAKEVGFEVIDEKIMPYQYVHTLKCLYEV